LGIDDIDRFEGHGVHYAATPMEATLCRDEEVVVVGAGNSAGQAAVFLGGVAKHVHMIVRRDALAATMSDYLVQRI
jgi:thioredoxin reductase (NADPH)